MGFNKHRLVIATDEAGYGPQLGPLVIAATCWEISEDDHSAERFASLGAGLEIDSLGRVQMADSKSLFSSRGQGGLRTLESAMLAIAAGCSPTPITCLSQWLGFVAPGYRATLDRCPWFKTLEEPFPIDLPKVDDWVGLAASLRAALEIQAITLKSASAVVIPAGEFNRLCEIAGNKATLLSEQTTLLALRTIAESSVNQIEVFSDKHGGRAYYGSLLQHYFPTGRLIIEAEGRQTSRYRIQLDQQEILWHFTAKGDSFPPVALASMVAKYTRERLMGCFNSYWQTKVPGIRPTAGYPGDAKRFLQELGGAIIDAEIERDLLIRQR